MLINPCQCENWLNLIIILLLLEAGPQPVIKMTPTCVFIKVIGGKYSLF